MDEKEVRKNARDYTRDAVYCVNDAFRWAFMAGDMENASLLFSALDDLKIACENMGESEKVWKRNETEEETVAMLEEALMLTEKALVLLKRS